MYKWHKHWETFYLIIEIIYVPIYIPLPNIYGYKRSSFENKNILEISLAFVFVLYYICKGGTIVFLDNELSILNNRLLVQYFRRFIQFL